MTVLANSLKRIWSATGHVPHLTGWGTHGSLPARRLLGRGYQSIVSLTGLARQSAPSLLVIVLNIFR
jgi:hypothetical protein